ncbi:MAG TPA: ABC transporter substrate-binding protein, partial [Usitatibacter sp.]|nr:ABC transporter substrate-binding protein [Usitatibacter sp.]
MKTVAAILHCFLFTCFLSAPADAREIVVGQVVDFTGEQGEASRDYVAGARIFFDALNARGGLNGATIRHVVLDGGRDPASVRARTRQLLDEQHADVLFGYVGDAAVAAAAAEPELRDGAVALVGPLAGGDDPSPAVFYTRPGHKAEIAEVVSHFRALQLSRFAQLAAADLANVDAVKARNAQALIVDADTATIAEFVKRYRPLDPGAMIVALSTANHRALFE